MSKVKIQGNASGSGTLTIAAPNTNTDRTLTLPDGAGEILTDAAIGTSVLAPDGDGSNLTGITTGKVLQVVSTTLNTKQSTTSTTFGNISGFNVAITPSSTSSKILILCDINAVSDGGGGLVRLTRNGSAIAVGTGATGVQVNATTSAFYNNGDNNVSRGQSFSYLDSPSTTSATTYQVQWRKGGAGTFVLNSNISNVNQPYTNYCISTITAMEIA